MKKIIMVTTLIAWSTMCLASSDCINSTYNQLDQTNAVSAYHNDLVDIVMNSDDLNQRKKALIKIRSLVGKLVELSNEVCSSLKGSK